MKLVLLIAAFVSVAFCVNTNGWDLDTIIDKVIADLDASPTDGIVSPEEISAFLLGGMDTNNDGLVHKHEFVNKWVETYGDSHDTTNAFFNNIDTDADHYLTMDDLFAQTGSIDGDGDGIVTVDEFRAYIHNVHPVGHGHVGGK